jgi:hypothetical protein
MSKMKPLTARNRATAIVVAALGLLVFVCYACSARGDTMLGKMSDPQFMGVTGAYAETPERWIVDVIATVNGKVSAAATYGGAVYTSEALCEKAVKADVQLNADAANAVTALSKDNPGAKIEVVIACAMKVNQ